LRSNIVLIFVVGGLNLSEVRSVRAEMMQGKSTGGFSGNREDVGRISTSGEGAAELEGGNRHPWILVGGTALISPVDVCKKLLTC
jgi:hypothetical protein